MNKNKARSTKTVELTVYRDASLWRVKFGVLKRAPGRPAKIEHLFRVVGEKLPYAAINTIRKHLLEKDLGINGIYVAHDSMGLPRYVGRGAIFTRLNARKKAQTLELLYFSFYVVAKQET